MSNAMSLRPFTTNDWIGFSGAERFEDGSEPLIGELFVEGLSTIAILDASGLALMVIDDEGEDVATITFPIAFAARAVAGLRNWMAFDVLRAMPGADLDDSIEAVRRRFAEALAEGEVCS